MYREPPAPPPVETLFEVDVWALKGRELVPLLWASASCAALAFVILLIADKPPEYQWVTPVVGVSAILLGVAGLRVNRKGRRTVRLLQEGDTRHLAIDTDLRLTFPITVRGSQEAVNLKGMPIREVLLQCIDGTGAAVVFRELRGAAHGERRKWLTNGIDGTKAGPMYEVSGLAAIGDLRAAIEKHNEEPERTSRS